MLSWLTTMFQSEAVVNLGAPGLTGIPDLVAWALMLPDAYGSLAIP